MKSLTFLVLVTVTAVATMVVPEPSHAQQDCVHIWFMRDPEVPECGSYLSLQVGDAIEVTTSAYTVNMNGCFTTLTKSYDGVKFFDDDAGCDESVSDAQCTIFASGTLSGKYEIAEISGGCYRVCAVCP